MGEYVVALLSEIEAFAKSCPSRIQLHTIYFGGGTPSLLPAETIESILHKIESNFDVQDGAEITLEVNPGTVDLEFFIRVRDAGVNRISMGVQSADPVELRLLERNHGYADAIEAVKWARQANIENISVDLIFGLPEQQLSTWQHSLDLALGLSPEHISLYALTIEHGTPLQHMVNRGLVTYPDPDRAADMYEYTMDRLAGEGFEHYEISNWARGTEGSAILSSQHNLQYWRNFPYIGMGAGAHGYVDNKRTANVLSPAAYIQKFEQASEPEFPRTPATVRIKESTQESEIAETMMMGLRLLDEGVSAIEFEERFEVRLDSKFQDEIADLEEKGLLEWGGDDNDQLRLTKKGRLLGNQVFMRFI